MKIQLMRISLLLFGFLCFATLQAQVQTGQTFQIAPAVVPEKCWAQHMHEDLMANDPTYRAIHEQNETHTQNFSTPKANALYTIPIVVHVVYHTADAVGTNANVTDAQIRNAVKTINEQFRKVPGSLGDGNGVDTQIEFALAVRDPAGNCTNGITRREISTSTLTAAQQNTYRTSGVSSGGPGITDAQIKSVDRWFTAAPRRYYEVWLVTEIDGNNGGAGVQGYATFPGSHNTIGDGAVILATDFVNPSSRTGTHEFGHSWNLYHTFQGDDSNSDGVPDTCPSNVTCGTNSDCVADTPPHRRSDGLTCLPDGNVDGCGITVGTYQHNYLDYATSSCVNEYTAGQRTRMQAVVDPAAGPRRSLLAGAPNNCMSLVPPSAPIVDFFANKSVMCAGESVTLYDTSDCVPNDFLSGDPWPGITHAWTMTNGTETLNSANQNPTFTPTGTGSYNVTLTITNGAGSNTLTKTGFIFINGTVVNACNYATPNRFPTQGAFLQTVNNVTFNTINKSTSTSINEGYQNYICTDNTVVLAGSTYTLSTTIRGGNAGSGTEVVNVDIDWNNDGDFLDAGEINVHTGSTPTNTNVTLSTPVTIPMTAVTNTLLRMRVYAESGTTISAAKKACGANFFVGEVEDYGVYISTPVCLPVATTQPANATICSGANATFTAVFSQSPTSYVWQISTDGGTTFTNLTNGAPYSNVTTASMTITGATVGLNNNQYQCVATNGCGSGNSTAAILTVNPTPATPTITAGGPTTFCSGGNVVLTSSSATGNTWSTAATTQTITVSTSGTYTVTVTATGCTSPASAGTTVTVNPTPVTPTIAAGGPITFCNGGSVVLTSSSATGNTWSTGATTTSITVSTGGTYTVTATSGGCTSPASAGTTVSVNPLPPTPTITAGGPTTFCGGGNVVLTSSAASGNTWSTGATTASITVTTSGIYTVTETTSGCTSPTSAGTTVTVNPAPTIAAGTITNPSACGMADGSIQVTGTGTGTLSWTGTASGSLTAVTLPATIPSLAAGTYNITFDNGSGCPSNTLTQSLSDPSAPATPTITAGGPTTFCAGGSVVLTSSSATDNVWSTGATTASITVTTSGSYTVSVVTGGCTSPASVATTVTVNPTPATPTIAAGGPTTFCTGGSVVLTSSAPSGNTWSTGETTPSITVTTAGTYTVSETTAGCASATSAGTTVSVNPVPTAPTITAGGSTTFCSGGNVVLTSSEATGNTWSTGATTPSITVTTSGTYSVTVTTGGCTSASSSGEVVTVNPSPATPTIAASGPTTFCAGGSVTLTSSAGSGNTWSTGETTPSIVVTTSGDYTVTETATGCTSPVSATTTVSVTPIPATPTITAGGPTTFCSGGSVTLTSSAGSGNTWSTGATTTSISVTTSGTYTVTTATSGCSSSASAGQTVTVNATPVIAIGTVTNPATCATATGSIEITGAGSGTLNWTGTASGTQAATLPATIPSLAAGSYTITFDDGTGCPSNTLTQGLNDPSASAPPTITASGATTFCDGGLVTLTSSEATGNTWSTGETTPSIDIIVSGDFTVTNVNAGCSTTSTVTTVVVNPTPVIAIGSVVDPTACATSTGSIEITGSGTGTLDYTGTSTGSLSVTLPTNVTNLGAGTYDFTFTTTAGCVSNTVSQSLVDPGAPVAPTISAGSAVTFCDGGSVTLSSNNSTGIMWSDGSTTPTITVTTSGTFTATVTVAGCVSAPSNTIDVVVNPNPVIAIGTVTDPASCATATGSIQITGTGIGSIGYTGTATGSVNPVTLPATIPNLAAGNYDIVFVSTDGCISNTVSQALSDPGAPPAPTITLSGSAQFCEGQQVTLTSSATTGNTWSNGATTSSITVTGSGSFTVTATVAGCTSAGSAITAVTMNNNPTVSLAPLAPICSDVMPRELIGGLPSTGVYSGFGVNDGRFNPAVGTIGFNTVTYSYTDVNGCVGSASGTIEVTDCSPLNPDSLLYYIPNSFTPNGDEHNNTFQPVFTQGFDVYNFNMTVYNRWGEIIFETKDASIGWDGTYKGQLVPSGNYGYIIRYKIPHNDAKKIVEGYVTLMR